MNHINGWFSSISQQLASPLPSAAAKEDQKNINFEGTNDSIENEKSNEAKLEGDDKNVTKIFDFIKSRNYANKFVDSVNSLASKIVHAKPEDLKHFFDAKQMLKELEEENEKFAAEESTIRQNQASSTILTTTSEPAWRGCTEETLVKKQILSLSFDSRNFLSDPPPEQLDFQFDYDVNVNLAMIMLNEDPNLRKMRFQLVPKIISEARFWRNYFYRISLIKQSIALKSMVDREHKDSASPGGEEILPSSSTSMKVDSQLNEDEPGTKTLNDRVDNLLSPSTVEFISDVTSVPDNDPDLVTARQELGILSAESSPPMERKSDNSKQNWENDLLSELNDYELINNGSNVNQIQQQKENNDWEEEIDDLLKNDFNLKHITSN